MDEEQKKQVAVFRFGVIHDLARGVQWGRGERERLLREKCGRKWQMPFSQKTRLTRSTILRWVRMYQAGNGKLESLSPRDRSDQGKSRALSEETACALTALRKEFPEAPVTFVIRQMGKRGLGAARGTLPRSTVYRFLHQQGLMDLAQARTQDRRKFEAELPNDLWQSDAMHGPMVEVEGKKRKTYLLAFLDDHSRLVPHGQFDLSEALGSYLDAFRQALLKRGLPRKLYLDNGAAFRSHHLEQITASLGIALIHSSPYQPQGRGKIERFFRSVREQFLADFQGKTLEELQGAFEQWLNEDYHQRKHAATGQSPFARFTSKMECLRAAPKDLNDYFRKAARRKVAKDRTISLDGRLYEAPVALIGKQVLVRYQETEPHRVEVFDNQKSYGWLTPVDLHVNCRVKRDKQSRVELGPAESKEKYQGGYLWTRRKEDKT